MAYQNIFTHLLMIVFTAVSHPAGLQNEIQKVQKKPVIKSEKIIYYDITASKNGRSYDFGKDLFLEYNDNGELLKESIILVDEETEKETTNLAYQNQYKTGKLTGAESYSVLRGGVKKEEIQFTYNADGKLEKEVHVDIPLHSTPRFRYKVRHPFRSKVHQCSAGKVTIYSAAKYATLLRGLKCVRADIPTQSTPLIPRQSTPLSRV
ncbi:MAG: hypothetical protein MUP99_00770 [Pedobacter sp.]|nr:hypothetical protein [Pedobacter sp.]